MNIQKLRSRQGKPFLVRWNKEFLDSISTKYFY